ncbi:MAG TPA: hypothetical protein VEH84_15400, partial [Alphaproteobacteria bacterium]|nr:hypothetical protein [Alphaproteobacteria bacterium]
MSAAAGRAGLAALLALVVLAPLPLAANRPWAWSLLALLLGLLLAWRRPALPGRALRLAALGFAAVLAWSLVQTLPLPAALAGLAHPVWGPAAAALPAADWRSIGLAPPDGWAAALRLAAYGCAFWLALGLARGGDAAAPAAALALAGAVYGAYGLAVTLSGSHTILWWPKWHYHDVVTATFVNRNTFATWAGTCLLAAVALVLDPARPGRRAVWLLCAAVAAAALAGSGSRAGVAATAAGLLAL